MGLSRNANAALLALIASAILSFVDNFVAEVSKDSGLWQFQVVRALMGLPLLFLGARLFKVRLLPANPGYLALRSLIVSTGLLMYFAALGFLPVAQAGAGLFSAPIWVLIFSVVIFARKMALWKFAVALVGFAGVLMVLGVNLASLSAFALVPLLAGAFYGLGMMATRHWCSAESAVALAFGVFVAMGLFSLVFLLYFSFWPIEGGTSEFILRGFEPVTGHFLWYTFIQAAGAVVAVSLISQAYRIGDPAFIAIFEYSFLVFAALWTFLLWGQGIDTKAVIGIVLIVLSGTVISLKAARD